MDAKAECLEALRGFIERADRAELVEAQAAIIHYAMSQPDRDGRSDAMDALRTALTGEMSRSTLAPEQQAFSSVVDAMIDRTRAAVVAGTAD